MFFLQHYDRIQLFRLILKQKYQYSEIWDMFDLQLQNSPNPQSNVQISFTYPTSFVCHLVWGTGANQWSCRLFFNFLSETQLSKIQVFT